MGRWELKTEDGWTAVEAKDLAGRFVGLRMRTYVDRDSTVAEWLRVDTMETWRLVHYGSDTVRWLASDLAELSRRSYTPL